MARLGEPTAENLVTDALVLGVLAQGPEGVVHRFAAEVCGVGDTGPVRGTQTQLNTFRDLPSRRALVVGIAPIPGSTLRDRNISGKADPDALVIADDVAILLEHKIRGTCEQGQLVRHALFWALQVDRQEPLWADAGGPPPGYHVAGWGDVRAWAERERARAECDLPALDAFEQILDQHVAHSPRSAGHAPEPVPVIPKPMAMPLARITEQWDLRALYGATAEFIAGHPVTIDQCVPDTLRMAQAFEAAGKPVPPALRYFTRHHAMTPLRSLTAMYEGTPRPDVWQPAWTGWWNRTIGRGADQAVLAAMLAWGQRQTGVKRANIETNVPVVWTLAPERSPGLEHFHDAVDSARRGA